MDYFTGYEVEQHADLVDLLILEAEEGIDQSRTIALRKLRTFLVANAAFVESSLAAVYG